MSRVTQHLLLFGEDERHWASFSEWTRRLAEGRTRRKPFAQTFIVMEKVRRENHFPKKWRRRAPVRRLGDKLGPGAVPLPEAGRLWHVLIFTDEERSRLVVTMAADIEAKRHKLTSPLLEGVTWGHGAGRLVYCESYGCRHTAFARMGRVARWPLDEKRRLVEAANPSWAPLGESGTPCAGGEEEASLFTR